MIYDAENNSSIWLEYMRLKIKLDVRKPLKRKKKIKRKNGTEFTVFYKYERLGEFCFACGLMSHTERFCRKVIDNRGEGIQKDYGGWLRAMLRWAANQNRSKWLRDKNDADWEAKFGRNINDPSFTEGSFGNKGKYVVVVHVSRIVGDNVIYLDNNKGDNGGILSKNSTQLKIENIGSGEDEIIGLDQEDRKMRRSGPSTNITILMWFSWRRIHQCGGYLAFTVC